MGGSAVAGEDRAVSEPLEVLQQVFGHPAFREGQAAVIERLLAGRSALAVFPTGGGKSVCYQLPALLLPGVTLVVSPLIALMKDQVDALRARGVAAARLDSSLSAGEVREVQAGLERGALKLLYVAPERLQNERFRARLQRVEVALLAVDEAHCISEWGHNFRPDYLRLARLARELSIPRVLALTATATPGVAEDVARAFGIAAGDVVRTSMHRPNLALVVTPTPAAERVERLRARLAELPGPAIVYVTLQRTAEEVAAALSAAGESAAPYHAGLEDAQRAQVQEDFLAGRLRVVAATIAFGMGIDKADVRAVYHLNLPKTLESYAQEVGRAGRDGQPSRCELFASRDDLVTLANFAHGDLPTREGLRGLLEDVLGRGELLEVSQYELSSAYDLRQLVVATALTYLELDGVLAPTAPVYAQYRLQLLRPVEQIVAGLDPERTAFVRGVLSAGKQGKTWITLAPDEVAAALGQPRGRILAAIGWLEEEEHARVEASSLRHGYRRLLPPPTPEQLEGTLGALLARFETREARDVERVEEVARWAEGRELASGGSGPRTGCRTRALLARFGEELGEDCGHCSGDGRREPTPLPATPLPPLGAEARALEAALRSEGHAALRLPRQRARFLCGLTSPATSRARLGKDPRFGALAAHPFREVLALCEG